MRRVAEHGSFSMRRCGSTRRSIEMTTDRACRRRCRRRRVADGVEDVRVRGLGIDPNDRAAISSIEGVESVARDIVDGEVGAGEVGGEHEGLDLVGLKRAASMVVFRHHVGVKAQSGVSIAACIARWRSVADDCLAL